MTADLGFGDGGNTPEGGQGDGGQGLNDAWSPILNVVPQELHDQVIPHLRGWDQNYSRMQSQYQPYKEFIDGGIDPNELRQAYQVAQALSTNPQGVYEVLHQQFGQQVAQQAMQQNAPQQPVGIQQGNPAEDIWEGLHPAIRQQFEQMKQATDTMAEIILGQRQQDQQAQEDAELQALYDDMAQRNPTFRELNKNGAAEPYINSLLAAGATPEQAEQAFMQFVQSVGQYNNRPKAPFVLGAGGNLVPEQKFNPTKLSDQQTRGLVADTLRALLPPGN